MTETPETEKTVTPPKTASLARVLIMVLLIVVALGAGALMQRALMDIPSALPPAALPPAERAVPASIEPSPVAGEEEKPQVSGLQEAQKLKEDIAALAAALAAIQEKLDQSVQLASAGRAAASIDGASAIAYARLQSAALSGLPFEAERQLMLKITAQDANLVETLTALEPLAQSGVMTLASLRAQWRDLAAPATAALRQEAAQTWTDRLIVALKGLVSIKSLKNPLGDDVAFAAVDRDLEQGHWAAALEKVAAMPSAVQTVVADWRARAAARAGVETLLATLSTRLIDRAMGSP